MLDASLNINFDKKKHICDFSDRLSKFEWRTTKFRNKILNCKKCDQKIQSQLEILIKNIEAQIQTYDDFLLKQVNNPFHTGAIEDPSNLINELKQQKADCLNFLFGINKNDLCGKCKKYHKKMIKNYGKYKNLLFVLSKIKGE